MVWESPSSFRRVFTTRTSHQLTFKVEFHKVENLINQNYWIDNNQSTCKTKACDFCIQRITLFKDQIKGNIKDDDM